MKQISGGIGNSDNCAVMVVLDILVEGSRVFGLMTLSCVVTRFEPDAFSCMGRSIWIRVINKRGGVQTWRIRADAEMELWLLCFCVVSSFFCVLVGFVVFVFGLF